jgi:hypothetical protein
MKNMFDLPAELVPEDELEVILAAALRASGGQLTRSTECWMASVVARHLVDQLSLAGLKIVRFPEPRLT